MANTSAKNKDFEDPTGISQKKKKTQEVSRKMGFREEGSFQGGRHSSTFFFIVKV